MEEASGMLIFRQARLLTAKLKSRASLSAHANVETIVERPFSDQASYARSQRVGFEDSPRWGSAVALGGMHLSHPNNPSQPHSHLCFPLPAAFARDTEWVTDLQYALQLPD